MKTETVEVVQTFKLDLKRFDKWVYVCAPDLFKGEPFFIPRKEFDRRCAQNKKHPHLWLFEDVKKYYKWRHHMVTEEYMESYLTEGCHYNPDWTNMYVKDPLAEMPRGESLIVFVGITDDGYLRRDGKRMRRAHYFDDIRQKGYPGYHNPDEIMKVLEKHPKVTKVWKEEIPWYNRDGGGLWQVCFLYLPTEQEFRQWFVAADKQGKYVCNFELWYEIRKSLKIKPFERKEGD